jgi:hypothetical protein
LKGRWWLQSRLKFINTAFKFIEMCFAGLPAHYKEGTATGMGRGPGMGVDSHAIPEQASYINLNATF